MAQSHWDTANLNAFLDTGHDTNGYPKVLADSTLGADGSSLDLPNLNISGWRIVRILATLRAVTGENTHWTRTILRLNGSSTAADYTWSVINSDATNVNDSSVGYAAGIEFGHMAGPSSKANTFGVCTGDLIHPGSTTMNKAVLTYAGHPDVNGTNALATSGCGYYFSTSVVSRVTFVANDGSNIAAGSRCLLIGLA